eukprot:gene5544-5524_t
MDDEPALDYERVGFEAFDRYVTHTLGVSHSLTIEYCPTGTGSVRSAVAVRDILPGQSVVSIPVKSLLSLDALEGHPLQPLIAEAQ